MKIIVLDLNTLTRNDIDFSPIEALGDVTYYDIPEKEKIVEICKGADIVLTNKTPFMRYEIENLPELKYIGLFATGYNNIDIEAAAEHGVAVVNVPGYSTDSVAQLAFSYILMHATSLPEYNASVEREEWCGSPTFAYFPYPIIELAGKTLGIAGFGAIGKKVAQIGNAFGMDVQIFSRRKYDDCPYRQVDKNELFQTSDFISLNCPLNAETENLVCEETLALMKENAFIVNTARGGLIDSKALADALNNGRIAGAGIDVLVQEPMAWDEPLLHAKNCFISPHVGWASIEARRRLILRVAENIKAWQDGEPINLVRP